MAFCSGAIRGSSLIESHRDEIFIERDHKCFQSSDRSVMVAANELILLEKICRSSGAQSAIGSCSYIPSAPTELKRSCAGVRSTGKRPSLKSKKAKAKALAFSSESHGRPVALTR